MFSLRALSRLLLALEGFLLVFPSLFGAMLMLGSLIANTKDSPLSNLSSLLAFCSFYALWHIYFDVITGQFERGKELNQVIAIFALTGFTLSIAAIILFELSIKSGIEIFGFGILYVPTCLHLLFEIKRQSGEIRPFWSIRNTYS